MARIYNHLLAYKLEWNRLQARARRQMRNKIERAAWREGLQDGFGDRAEVREIVDATIEGRYDHISY